MTTHRPLLWITLFFCAGILISRYISPPFLFLCITAMLVSVLSAVFLNRKIISSVFLVISLIILGAISAENYTYLAQNHIYHVAKYYRGKPISLEGIIVSDVQKRRSFKGVKTTFELDVKRIKTKWGWKKKTGKVLVNIFRDDTFSYGDALRLEGKLYEPFNFSEDPKFSYKKYLRAKNIYLLFSVKKDGDIEILRSGKGNFIKGLSLRFKDRLKMIFEKYLSKSEAGLMQALIVGDRYDIPQQINDLFIQTGTAHILAISGFNVGIVAFLVFLILKVLPGGRRVQPLIAILVLVFYAFLTGTRPPVVRATIMAVVFLLSFLFEKENDPINTLSFAALLLLIANPFNLFDVGFQLSFVSVLSIILLYSRILQWTERFLPQKTNRPLLFLSQSFAVSLAAWGGVAGLIAYYFDIVTPVTILANLVIIPLISLIVALGLGLLGVCGIPFLATAFASCLHVMLNLTVAFIYVFSLIPGAYFYLKNVSFWYTLSYYILFVGILFLPTLTELTKGRKYDTVNHMKKIFALFLAVAMVFFAGNAQAFWIWTPETNRWVNPKYDVKDTPEEQLTFAKSFLTSKEYKKAIQEFEKLIRSYPKAREAAEAQFLIGAAFEEQVKLFEAYKAYQKVAEKYPFSERFSEVVEKQYHLGERMLEGEGKKSKFASAIIGGELDVVEVFRTVIKNAPYGKYAAPSQYKIGLYLTEKGLYQEARDELEKVINDYPNSEWVKGARYQIALVDAQRSTAAEYDQKITSTAVDEFKEFVKTYPDAELSDNAHEQIKGLREKEAENSFLVARFYEKQKNYKSARIYYQGVADDYHGSPWAAQASAKLVELDAKEKDSKTK